MKIALSINVEVNPGAHIEDALEHVLALSKKLNVMVCFSFNEASLWAKPEDTIGTLTYRYEKRYSRKRCVSEMSGIVKGERT